MLAAREITDHELRDACDEILNGLEAGTSYIVTRHGKRIAHLISIANEPTGDKASILAAFRDAPAVDYVKFRDDLDRAFGYSPEPEEHGGENT